MTSHIFYNNLLISSLFPHQIKTYSITSSSTEHHRFLNGLALLLNGSNQCTSVYPWLKEKQLLISRVIEIRPILTSHIFEYNKNNCIKHILDPLFNDVISNLEELLYYDIDKIFGNIIIDKHYK
ncbi:unnamed protein product, partial [Rotaria sp. Silwood1]